MSGFIYQMNKNETNVKLPLCLGVVVKDCFRTHLPHTPAWVTAPVGSVIGKGGVSQRGTLMQW